MDGYKTPRLDGIHLRGLKGLARELAKPLSIVFSFLEHE